MLRKILVATLAGSVLAWSASAQPSGQRIVIEQPSAASGPRQEGLVRVQTSINFFIPGPTGDSEEAAQARDRARRLVYDMAAKECDLLRDVIAKDCRLESITSNLTLNRQYGQQAEGYSINGSMSFQIMLK